MDMDIDFWKPHVVIVYSKYHHNHHNLGKQIHSQDKEPIKAERLVREAHRIYIQLYGKDYEHVGNCANDLADILLSQGMYIFMHMNT
jgi:hypothetical protein